MTTNGRGHGGKRPGAGRPRSTFRIDAPHRSRETFDSPAPVHVTMRCPHIAALRWQKIYEALHGVLARFVDGEQFRVVHLFSSAVTFGGWSRPFSIPAEYRPLPVSAPRTDLMRRGWAYAGPLDPYDIPGPPR
jgi:hypothetical protein